MDLNDLTHEYFAGLLSSKFQLHNERAGTELELVEATKLGAGRRGRRDPFSLIFRGPRDVVFPQRIYRLQADRLGTLDIFLVPVGPNEEGTGMLYQAIFT